MSEQKMDSRLALADQFFALATQQTEAAMRSSLSRLYDANFHVAAALTGGTAHGDIAKRLTDAYGQIGQDFRKYHKLRTERDYHHDYFRRTAIADAKDWYQEVCGKACRYTFSFEGLLIHPKGNDMSADQVRVEIEGRLQHAGLLSVLDLARTQFLDLPDGPYAELVLTDGGKEDVIRRALADSTVGVELSIHPIWKIENIGEAEIAISPSGGIVAAQILAVTLRSGSATTVVQVAVTWLAEEELKRMLGTEKPPLKDLVREYVENWLHWGGESYWDPRRHPRLEITADRALSLYRSLQRTA